ncbi:TPA: hypothetical protein ACONRF_000489 [Staphylococcus aureus]|nr:MULTISPECIES: hypothetical protein [Staphylococcus]MCS5192298.1 hypothetical protein [Staphylococcus aureus]MCT6542839.1 hypothetical protein [Staphylococcus aureus]GBW41719.1 hypothetical protein M1K158_0081 [Staphylococcus aureus]GBY28033.1 hypothetical protein M6K044_0082 [Staphylococcus aureus]GBZ13288.1 hypothetical protein M6K116_0950 [Staphylococcus aureus]
MCQLMGDFGIDREFKAIKEASNSNMLLDAQMMTLAKLISHF